MYVYFKLLMIYKYVTKIRLKQYLCDGGGTRWLSHEKLSDQNIVQLSILSNVTLNTFCNTHRISLSTIVMKYALSTAITLSTCIRSSNSHEITSLFCNLLLSQSSGVHHTNIDLTVFTTISNI